MKNRKETVYTIATAHLDTSWLWLLEQTIDDYLPDTVKRNLAFMKKYPAYKFNFEGSYRYELIKEYLDSNSETTCHWYDKRSDPIRCFKFFISVVKKEGFTIRKMNRKLTTKL